MSATSCSGKRHVRGVFRWQWLLAIVLVAALATADTQAIAFRWGVNKGKLIYNDFMNVEPSGAQADDDIDINDLQFIYGRFGSTCSNAHPPQDPVNPLA